MADLGVARVPVGIKYDQGKPRARVFTAGPGLELVPEETVTGIAEILNHGAVKYAPRNWEKGIAWVRVYQAALRHLSAWVKGEDLDPESGFRHLDHAACNLAFLQAFSRRGIGPDDRKEFYP